MRLLDPATFPSRRRGGAPGPEWVSHRDAAIVALCWIVGLRPLQIEHLTGASWVPQEMVIRYRGVGRYAGIRDRDAPVLERARDAILAYLRACPFPVEAAGPLVLRPDGKGFREADVTAFNVRLRKVSYGVVPALANLTARYGFYVNRTLRTDGTVEKLVGRTGR